jgi:hypothetical protein
MASRLVRSMSFCRLLIPLATGEHDHVAHARSTQG